MLASGGTLLYLKPTLTGEEPADILHYARAHACFPHEPTSDQFFDEAQFESYRRLGQDVATRALEPVLERIDAGEMLYRDQLGVRVRELHDRLGLTTIMVTHDMAEALLLADRVLVMERGRIVADAVPRALLAGDGGAAADALVAVPREQARRLQALERGQ